MGRGEHPLLPMFRICLHSWQFVLLHIPWPRNSQGFNAFLEGEKGVVEQSCHIKASPQPLKGFPPLPSSALSSTQHFSHSAFLLRNGLEAFYLYGNDKSDTKQLKRSARFKLKVHQGRNVNSGWGVSICPSRAAQLLLWGKSLEERVTLRSSF